MDRAFTNVREDSLVAAHHDAEHVSHVQCITIGSTVIHREMITHASHRRTEPTHGTGSQFILVYIRVDTPQNAARIAFSLTRSRLLHRAAKKNRMRRVTRATSDVFVSFFSADQHFSENMISVFQK